MRPSLIDTAGYPPQTVERVERLLELLVEVSGHPYLAPRLRLHGGTALNVFHLSMPRLSVDADLTYVGRVALDEYEAERPELESAMSDLGTRMGYRVATSEKVEHSGRTYKLRYRYGDQRDLMKVDLIYLNRAPLLPTETATCFACSPEIGVRTLALPELVAGKTKALFDRLAIRDLYDIHRVQTSGLPTRMADGDADRHRLQRRVRWREEFLGVKLQFAATFRALRLVDLGSPFAGRALPRGRPYSGRPSGSISTRHSRMASRLKIGETTRTIGTLFSGSVKSQC